MSMKFESVLMIGCLMAQSCLFADVIVEFKFQLDKLVRPVNICCKRLLKTCHCLLRKVCICINRIFRWMIFATNIFGHNRCSQKQAFGGLIGTIKIHTGGWTMDWFWSQPLVNAGVDAGNQPFWMWCLCLRLRKWRKFVMYDGSYPTHLNCTYYCAAAWFCRRSEHLIRNGYLARWELKRLVKILLRVNSVR